MEPLIKRLSKLDAELYTLGRNSQRLSELARRHRRDSPTFTRLSDAMEAVDARLLPGEVASSPRAPAWISSILCRPGGEVGGFVRIKAYLILPS